MYSYDNLGGSRNMPMTCSANSREGVIVDNGAVTLPDNVPIPNPGNGVIVDNGAVTLPDSIPIPNPGEGGIIIDGGAVTLPDSIPIPNPGQNVPIDPGFTFPVFPIPNPPCFFCGSANNQTARVRFLNAAGGYPSLRIYINNRMIVDGLGFSTLTPYGRVSSGFQTVSVTGPNGYTYIQKTIPFTSNQATTVAVINTPRGLDLMQISEQSCNRSNIASCFRVVNLAVNSNPLDVILYDGRVVYTDVRYKEVTSFKRIRPGEYQFYLAETRSNISTGIVDIETIGMETVAYDEIPSVLVSFYVNVRPNSTYTVYILNPDRNSNSLITFIVEDR